MNFSKLVLTLLASSIFCLGFSQPPVSIITPTLIPAELGNLTNYTVNDGLPSSEVYDFEIDENGYVWLATDNGLCKFNSEGFEVFTKEDGLPENMIIRVQKTEKHIWALTLGLKILKITPATGKIESIHQKDWLDSTSQKIDLFDWQVDADENVWLSVWEAPADPSRFMDHQNSRFFKIMKEGVKELEIQSPDPYQLLIADFDSFELLAFNKNCPPNSQAAYHSENLPETLKEIHIGNAFPFKLGPHGYRRITGIKWTNGTYIIGLNNYLFQLDFDHKRISQLIQMPNDVACLSVDNKGDLWVGLNTQGGLLKMVGKDLSQATFYHYLEHVTVAEAHHLPDGGMWIGTREKGMFFRPPSVFEPLHLPAGPNLSISALENQQGRVFLVTELTHGYELIHQTNQWDFHPIISTKNLANFWCESKTDACFACLSSMGGLVTFRESNPSKLTRLAGNPALRFYRVNDHRFVSSGTWGYQFVDIAENPTYTSKPKSFLTRVFGFYLGDELMLAATSRGVFEIVNELPVPYLREHIDEKTRVNTIVKDGNDHIWYGTHSNGLYVQNLLDGQVINVTTDNGLPNNAVTCLQPNGSRVWVGTKNGLCLVTLQNGNANVQVFTLAHGLTSNEIKELSMLDSHLIVNTYGGIMAMNLSKLPSNPDVFPLFHQDFQVNDQQVDFEQNATFQPDQNDLVFSFGGFHFHTKEPKFWYRGINQDQVWTSTKDNRLYFSKMKPGNYHLEISSQPEFIQGKSLRYTFNIAQPFTQSVWFLVLVIVGTGMTFFAIFRVILSRLRLRNQLLMSQQTAMISQMNPHFIFNTLNSIQYFMGEKGSEKAYDYLNSFSRLIRRVLDSSVTGEIQLEDEIRTLKEYLELEELRFENAIEIEVSVDERLTDRSESIFIPSMIIQPFLENAIIHGLLPKKDPPKKLTLSFNLSQNDLVIIIADNGIGREVAQNIRPQNRDFKKKSLGMSNTMDRIQLLNKVQKSNIRISIVDVVPSGTEVKLIIPIG